MKSIFVGSNIAVKAFLKTQVAIKIRLDYTLACRSALKSYTQ